MSDYISREEALEVFCRWCGICPKEKQKPLECDDILGNVLHSLPAADVVEVDMKDLRIKKAIKTLCEFYSTVKKSDYVQKPLAWALYQTWKSFDKMDGGGDK